MSEISEIEIKSMTKEQNYMRGYEDGKSDVLNKIRAEIDEIPLSEPMVSADGLYCYGSKSITMGHFREKVLDIIDKCRNEVSE